MERRYDETPARSATSAWPVTIGLELLSHSSARADAELRGLNFSWRESVIDEATKGL